MATSRERILSCAQELILSHGFSAMTIDAVCKSAGITKGGFFHHFANKNELGLATLNKFWTDIAARESKAAFKKIHHPVEAIEAYLDYIIEAYQCPELQKGCMLAIFTIELAEINQNLFKAASGHFASWRATIAGMLEHAAKQSGKNIFAHAWADMFIATLEGGLVLSKSSADPEAITRTLTLYKTLLIQALKPCTGYSTTT